MTRFWITLEQGVRLVFMGLGQMQGGEVFIPKIPSTKITDLADVMAPGIKRKIIGIRPGEKLHEVLITEEEATHTMEFKDHFIIEPEFPFWKKDIAMKGKSLPDNYRYASDNNTEWLDPEQIRKLVDKA
jgi:UDP-N-acetylglucosamine 4,6-dehydratase/5-epimerase